MEPAALDRASAALKVRLGVGLRLSEMKQSYVPDGSDINGFPMCQA